MITKNVIAFFACAGLFLVAAGCSRPTDCQPAIAANAALCSADVYIDASTTDPVCLSSGGLPECRADDAVCYRCTGGTFNDGCLIKNAEQSIECVHSCANC